jgi:hypothetical protein
MAKDKTPEEKQLDQVNKAAVQKAEDKKQHEEKLEEHADKNQKDSAVPKTDTVAKIDAASDEALENAKDAKAEKASGMVGDLGNMATQTDWSVDDHNRRVHPNDVKFEVKYPASYKGKKIMPEGVTVVSREVGEQFHELGIGKIVK